MISVLSYLRDNIKELTPYKSARSEYKGKAEIFIDANENPYPLGYNRYPDAYQSSLKKAIAEFRNITSSQIALGNGSDELIDLLLRLFCVPSQDNILTYKPGFSMYIFAAQVNDIKVKEYPLIAPDYELPITDYVEQVDDNTKVIFICSPNNPTGTSVSISDIEHICASTDRLVVVDEAYIDFSSQPSAITLLDMYDNLCVLQTFSKALGGAGLRIGMAYAHPELIRVIDAVRMPYNISSSNQERAVELLSDKLGYEERIEEILSEKEKMGGLLTEVDLVKKVIPSDANFFLVEFHRCREVFLALRDQGIIVRDRSSNYLCNDCLRLTIGTPEENKRLMEALHTLSQSLNPVS